ncbi:unnamed protein product, partial [Allacma fusca]
MSETPSLWDPDVDGTASDVEDDSCASYDCESKCFLLALDTTSVM